MSFSKRLALFFTSCILCALIFALISAAILSSLPSNSNPVLVDDTYSASPPEDTGILVCIKNADSGYGFVFLSIFYERCEIEVRSLPANSLLPGNEFSLQQLSQKGDLRLIAQSCSNFFGCNNFGYMVLSNKNCADFIDNCQGVIYTNSSDISFTANGSVIHIAAGSHYLNGSMLTNTVLGVETDREVMFAAAQMVSDFLQRQMSSGDFEEFSENFVSVLTHAETDISYVDWANRTAHLEKIGNEGDFSAVLPKGYLTVKGTETFFVLTG